MERIDIVARVALSIALIVVVARVMAAAFRKIRQPAVVGEIVAGLILGGVLTGNVRSCFFPADVQEHLAVVAGLGLIFFMFIVGLELDLGLVRGKVRLAGIISTSSILLPFLLGVALALWLHRRHGVVDQSPIDVLPFALFIGASMSITAFPVLARILAERRMHRTELGTISLACAAVDDVLAWSLLAAVVAIVKSDGPRDVVQTVALSVAFVAMMFLVLRPRLGLLAERYQRAGRLTPDVLAVVVVGFLTSAYITETIGIHAIFGAFLFGVIMPRDGTAEFFREILVRLEQVSVLLLLPVFFITVGLRTDVQSIGGQGLFEFLAVVAVACSSKFIGAAGAARLLGMRASKAAAIGILMNTRGLTELVILNVGKSLGVLDDSLFTILVLMAVFTTVITEPLLRLVYPDRAVTRDIAEAERRSLGAPQGLRVLAVVQDPDRSHVVDTGIAFVSTQRPAEVVIVHLLEAQTPLEVGSGLTFELARAAESLEALRRLERRVQSRGFACVVRSQFTTDAPHDIGELARSADADILLIAHEPGPSRISLAEIDQLLEDPPCPSVLLIDPVQRGVQQDGDVVVWQPSGRDGVFALEIAVRVGRAADSPITVYTSERRDRRLAALQKRLKAMGSDLLVVPTDGWRPQELWGRPGVRLVVAAAFQAPDTPPSAVANELYAAGGVATVLARDAHHSRSAKGADAFLDEQASKESVR